MPPSQEASLCRRTMPSETWFRRLRRKLSGNGATTEGAMDNDPHYLAPPSAEETAAWTSLYVHPEKGSAAVLTSLDPTDDAMLPVLPVEHVSVPARGAHERLRRSARPPARPPGATRGSNEGASTR